MNIKAFFGEALGQALELGIGTPADVLRHVPPEVLATYLPRPLWARLLTACLGAPKVDAQLVVETIGVPNLCEHVPTAIIWACIAEIGARSVGQVVAAPPIMTRASLSATPAPASGAATATSTQAPSSVLAPPPAAAATPAAAAGPSTPPVNEPLADLITELEADDRPIAPARGRTPTAQRFRQSNTGIGRLGATPQPRRPQAQAAPPAPSRPRRTGTDVEDAETETGGEWRSREIAVDDSQLVDWQSTETTQSASGGDDDFGDAGGRKR